jgi:hypothetical protein
MRGATRIALVRIANRNAECPIHRHATVVSTGPGLQEKVDSNVHELTTSLEHHKNGEVSWLLSVDDLYLSPLSFDQPPGLSDGSCQRIRIESRGYFDHRYIDVGLHIAG